ncbi:MAG: cation diffusion facilitator family transporter [Burkholderiaceae bacterium]|nr:cation diffusion facilitator family transporter [Burkholderiaceae bacterium]
MTHRHASGAGVSSHPHRHSHSPAHAHSHPDAQSHSGAQSSGHAHDHRHDHRRGAGAKPSAALAWSLAIVLGYALLEVVVGIISGSLALASDGVHMLTDAAALGLALGAQRFARREAGPRMSFGYGRAETLAALMNGLFYVGVLAFIVLEAFGRMRDTPPIDVRYALPVAVAGLLVNAGVWRLLHGERHELNTRSALLHVIGDFAGSVIAIVALVTVWLTGWTLIDPILTLAICALLLVATTRLLRDSVRVLMNAVPEGVDVDEVERSLLGTRGVHWVRDLHLWSLGDGSPAMSAHVAIDEMAEWPQILADIRAAMDERHGIRHLTLQPETTQEEALLMRQEAQCRRRA